MYKTIKLSVPSFLVIGLFIAGCSQQPASTSTAPLAVADIQPAATVRPTAIDTQVQEVVLPRAPKVYQKPMVKPVQRMVKPIQRPRMVKPIQRHKMMSTMKHRMAKPTQKHSAY